MLKIISKPYKKEGKTCKFVICECDCGNIKEFRYNDVMSQHTKSCGCLNKIVNRDRMTTHGLSNTRIYRIWKGMKKRCYNINSSIYKYYGGKGIRVCDEWANKDDGFINFYNWSINNKYTDDLTIDRIDSNKGYLPQNCQWITLSENVSKSNKCRNPKFVYYIKTPDKKTFIRYNRRKIRNEFGISDKIITKLLKKEINDYNGWELIKEKYK